MHRHAAVLLVSALWFSHQPPPTARDVVLASAEAIGGVERLRGIRGVRVEETGGEYMVSTVTRRDAPPKLIAQTIVTHRTGEAYRRTVSQSFPMRAGRLTSATIADRGTVAAVRGTGVVPAGSFDLAVAEEELMLAPERAVLTLLDANDLRLERDTTLSGVPHHVVSATWKGARLRLTVDAASSFPTRLEVVRAYPTNVFWAMWGDLRSVTTWSAWALEANGVWYPRQRTTTLNGEPFRDYVVTSLDLDAQLSSDSIAIPDSVRAAFARRLSADSATLGSAATPKLVPVLLADDVVLYQGGYQSSAVRQPDGVVVLEAPESNAKSRAVLADIASRWPGVRVKAVVTTSPMWMHIGGLREYSARGIPIYALDVNVGIVRALLGAPHAQTPDSLARSRVSPVVRSVAGRMTLGTGPNAIELRPARGQHASSMLLAWLPERRLLYASDILIPDAFEPVFTAAYKAELQRIVEREGLSVERLFAEHLPATPWASVAH